MLYRAQSLRRLSQGKRGILKNPNLERSRRPKDTSAFAHGVAGMWMQNKFGLDYRRLSLFCTGEIEIAKGYATSGFGLILIEPIGSYSLCVSKNCIDLFAKLQFRPEDSNSEGGIERILNSLDYVEYKNAGIKEAAETGCEVMLYAESYSYQCLE